MLLRDQWRFSDDPPYTVDAITLGTALELGLSNRDHHAFGMSPVHLSSCLSFWHWRSAAACPRTASAFQAAWQLRAELCRIGHDPVFSWLRLMSRRPAFGNTLNWSRALEGPASLRSPGISNSRDFTSVNHDARQRKHCRSTDRHEIQTGIHIGFSVSPQLTPYPKFFIFIISQLLSIEPTTPAKSIIKHLYALISELTHACVAVWWLLDEKQEMHLRLLKHDEKGKSDASQFL